MKPGTIGGLALGAGLLLGACTPTQLREDASTEPTQAAESVAPAATAEATDAPAASQTAEPTPDDYEY